MTQVCPVLLKKCGKYDTSLLNIPKCMILGLLKDASTINRGGKMFKYLMDHRMADVEERIKVRECFEQFQSWMQKGGFNIEVGEVGFLSFLDDFLEL